MQPWEEIAAFIVSFFAMVFVAAAYFFQKKSLYLLCQAIGIVGIVISYFFTKEFFAMIGLGVGLIRTLSFYAYERQGKSAPLYLAVLFATLSVAAYLIVNMGILHTAKPLDLLCLAALVLYAFIFRIRNMKLVRFTVLIPCALSITYNVLASSTIFIVLLYVFEFCASITSIFKFYVFPNIRRKTNENG